MLELCNLSIVALLVFFIIICGSFRLITDRIFYNLPPGPLPLPYVGTIWFVALKMGRRGTAEALHKIAQQFGPIFTCYVGQHRVVVLDDAKLIRQAMDHEQGKRFDGRYESFISGFEILSDGIVFANGAVWKKNRRFAMKAMRDFGMGKEAIAGRIHEQVSELLAQFDRQEGQAFNPRSAIASAVANVIGSIIFGNRFVSSGNVRYHEIMCLISEAFKLDRTYTSITTIFPLIARLKRPKFVQLSLDVRSLVKQALDEALAEHCADFEPDHIRDFVDIFIKCERYGEPISADDFAMIMTEMFVAGMETTTTVLSWILLYMAKYPEIQRKCQQEIDRLLLKDGVALLMEDCHRLTYVEAVINEVHRHSSVQPLINHCNYEKPAKIGSFDVPPNTMVLLNLDAVHHDENYWENPWQFDPQRWIGDDDGCLRSHALHFLPFGIGPRICLGEALAKAEIFIFSVSLLRRFDLRLKSEVSLDDGIHGRTHNTPPYNIIAECRK